MSEDTVDRNWIPQFVGVECAIGFPGYEIRSGGFGGGFTMQSEDSDDSENVVDVEIVEAGDTEPNFQAVTDCCKDKDIAFCERTV